MVKPKTSKHTPSKTVKPSAAAIKAASMKKTSKFAAILGKLGGRPIGS